MAFAPGGKTLQPVLDAALDLLGWDMWGVRWGSPKKAPTAAPGDQLALSLVKRAAPKRNKEPHQHP